jgi:hypothetical protein
MILLSIGFISGIALSVVVTLGFRIYEDIKKK